MLPILPALQLQLSDSAGKDHDSRGPSPVEVLQTSLDADDY